MPPTLPFLLTLWTASPTLATAADGAGVDRVGVDLEHLGKRERQRGQATWISPHVEGDLDVIRPVLRRARLFARVNPLGSESGREVEAVLGHGAQVLMLPMVADARQAADFVGLVKGRAIVVLLVEHAEGLKRLREIVRMPGVDEVHIGLNDLAISLGLRNRWLALCGDLIADAGAIVREANLRFSLGGIGRAGDNDLPIPSDLIYAEYARTGARGAILARSFFDRGEVDLAIEVARARKALDDWWARPPADLASAHADLCRYAERAEV
ncbi:MAG TPA: aldolase/citrate lyase family protein [Thermoanaerobaculia bacterium]|nr:aldolase/citrate lyase family protein [Thermoanaerobaculia bacterium]